MTFLLCSDTWVASVNLKLELRQFVMSGGFEGYATVDPY